MWQALFSLLRPLLGDLLKLVFTELVFQKKAVLTEKVSYASSDSAAAPFGGASDVLDRVESRV